MKHRGLKRTWTEAHTPMQSAVSWTALPAEIISCIYAYCVPRDGYSLALVCKRNYDAWANYLACYAHVIPDTVYPKNVLDETSIAVRKRLRVQLATLMLARGNDFRNLSTPATQDEERQILESAHANGVLTSDRTFMDGFRPRNKCGIEAYSEDLSTRLLEQLEIYDTSVWKYLWLSNSLCSPHNFELCCRAVRHGFTTALKALINTVPIEHQLINLDVPFHRESMLMAQVRYCHPSDRESMFWCLCRCLGRAPDRALMAAATFRVRQAFYDIINDRGMASETFRYMAYRDIRRSCGIRNGQLVLYPGDAELLMDMEARRDWASWLRTVKELVRELVPQNGVDYNVANLPQSSDATPLILLYTANQIAYPHRQSRMTLESFICRLLRAGVDSDLLRLFVADNPPLFIKDERELKCAAEDGCLKLAAKYATSEAGGPNDIAYWKQRAMCDRDKLVQWLLSRCV